MTYVVALLSNTETAIYCALSQCQRCLNLMPVCLHGKSVLLTLYNDSYPLHIVLILPSPTVKKILSKVPIYIIKNQLFFNHCIALEKNFALIK